MAFRSVTRSVVSALSPLARPSFCLAFARVAMWMLTLLLVASGPVVASALSAAPANGLSVTPSSGAAGSLFTLTATVGVNGSPATGGSVSFYEGKRLLGSSQVIGTTSGGGVVGTAVWRTRSLQPGTDSLTATYAGPGGKSTSGAVQVTVTGKLGSATALTSTGVQGSYALTGTVLGAGIADPTGSVVFTDKQTNVKLGTVALDPATRVQTFVTASTPSFGSGNSPRYSAVGDFNGDGIPDIVEVVNSGLQILIGKGGGTFELPAATPQVYASSPPILGDFNGDGRLDIAVASYDSVALLLGSGDGSFAVPVSYKAQSNSNSSIQAIVAGDFDGDGKLDLAAANSCCNTVAVFLGNGDGTLKPYTTFTTGGYSSALKTADFNGDGKLDLVVANTGDQTLSVLFGNGDGTFQAQTSYSVVNPRTNFSIGLDVGDVNGDGSPDIVAFNAYYPYTIGIFLNNGSGTFTPQTFSASPAGTFVGLGDVNGDGKLDLYCFSYGNSTYFVSIFAGHGDGTFASNPISYAVGSGGGSLLFTDLDGDGKPDFLTSNPSDGTLSVLSNTITQSAALTGVTLTGVTADKVAATYQGDSVYAASTSNFLTLPSNPAVGHTTFSVSPTSGPLGTVFTLTANALDVNGQPVITGAVTFKDGTSALTTVEVVSSTGVATFKTSGLALGSHSLQAVYNGNTLYKGSSSAAQTVQVTGKNPTATLLGATGAQGSYQLTAGVEGFGKGSPTGSVSFMDTTAGKTLGTVSLSAANSVAGFLQPVIYSLAGYPQQVVSIDVNNDGKLDLVVAGADKGQFSVQLGNGDGTFAPAKTYGDSSYNAHNVIVADFNGDGKLDVLAQGALVDLFLGNGDGTFQSTPLTVFANSGNDISMTSVGTGDLNRDGNLDVVLTTYSNTGPTSGSRYHELVLLGNGDGTFSSPVSYDLASYCLDLCPVADVDGDGILDIVIPYYGTPNTIAILKGNGDGTFAAAKNIPNFNVQTNLRSALIVDVNQDGLPDIVVGSSNIAFYVALNQGGGNFAAPVMYTTPGFTFSQLAVADVTGDGVPDVIGSGSNGSVAVFTGKGDGTFSTAVYFSANSTGDAIQWIAAGDFNGDGRTDLAAAYNSPNYPHLSVLIGEGSNLVSLSNVTLTGSGLNNVQASYSGDSQFSTSASNTISLPAKPLVTATALTVTPATAAPGSLVTLTATVTTGTSTPVTAGSVTFYNGAASIGKIDLTTQDGGGVSPGTATLNTRSLPRGTNSITAKFTGLNWLKSSTSATKTVTVTGTASSATATSLGVTGTAGNYTLSATVSGYGALPPTGKVNFTDTTANKLLGTATLSSRLGGFSLIPSAIPDQLGTTSETIIAADLDGDGNLDAATCSGSTVLISFGNGDGTFKQLKTIPTGYCYSFDIGDMNGDGKQDLLVVGYQSLSVSLGNGDGTFATAIVVNDGTFLNRTVKLADVNGDGKLDAIVYSTYDSNGESVRIFYGNGDGSFQTPLFFPFSSNANPTAFAVGDFNGDGRADVAILCDTLGSSEVLLGAPGGTFQVKPLDFMQTGYYSVSAKDIKTVDLDGDGNLDLVVAGRAVYVAMGKGDGTFGTPTLYTDSAFEGASSLSIVDLDGDGKLDLVTTGGGYSGQIGLQLGKGDGTFGPFQYLSNFQSNQYAAVGDFNNDGRPDILNSYVPSVYNVQPYKYTLFLNQANTTATLTGVSASGTGLHNVVATYLGDAVYTGSTSAPQQLTAVAATPTVTLTAQPSASPAFGTSLSVLVAVSGGQGAPVPTGSLSYTVDGGAAQAATLSQGSATLALGSALAVGPHTLAVKYSGDTLYTATSKTLAITVTKAPQTINFPPIADNVYGSGVFGVVGIASSGLSVTVKVISGPATVAPASTNVTAVTVYAAGTVVLEADQAGDGSYAAAPPVQQTFTFTKAPLAVVVGDATKVYGSANPAFSATATGLRNGDSVVILYNTTATAASGYGSYAINATISGAAAANYAPIITPGTLSVTKAPLTVTVNDATRLYGGANPAFTGTVTGLQGTDTATATYSTNATASSPVGKAYAITATVAGSSLGSYTLNVVPGKLTVAPAPLTITVANSSKVYGTANPAFTSTMTGNLNGDSIPVTYSTSATGTTGVGSYAVAASTTASNYTATVILGTLTVTPAPLTVLVNSFTKIYGTDTPAFTGSVSGLLFNDTVTASYTSAALKTSGVGGYPISASVSGGASANYTTLVTPGTLTIAKASLTATAANVSRQYGVANPALTYTISGFANADTSAVVSGTATLTTTATPSSPKGTYPISFVTQGLTAANYDFLYAPGTLTVSGGAPQTISFGSLPDRVYGAAPISLGATASSGLAVSYKVVGPATVSGSLLTITGAGVVTVTASQAGDGNYAAAKAVMQSFTVSKAALTVTAANASRQYGAPNPVFTYSVIGFVDSDTSAVVSGTAALSTTADLTSPAGTYAITFATESLTAANYSFNYLAGTLTIAGLKPQTITFGSLSNTTYGASSFALSATASSGLPVSYSVTGPAKLSGSTLTVTGAGTVAVTASQAGDGNYAAAPSVVQSFAVSKAVLTVTADNVSRNYAVANPSLTFTLTGFVNGDTGAVVSGTANLVTTANLTSPVGTYPITFATENLAATNYTLLYVAGTLTVGKSSQTITFGPLANLSYGSAPLTLTASASSALPITYSVSGPATISGSVLSVNGAGSVSVTASQPGNGNYGAAPTVLRSFSVAKALLTATAESVSKPYGGINPALTYTIRGFVHGDSSAVVTGTATLSTTATSTSSVGSYPIVFGSETLSASNYTFGYVPGTLTVTPMATVATPTFSPVGGIFTAPQTVSLSDASKGSVVRYTLDGTIPTLNSPLYSAPIHVASTKTITAIAFLNGVSSNPVSQTYTITSAQCQLIDYSKGFAVTGLSLNGGATVTGNALQLTDRGRFEARSAFYSTAVPVNAYSTDFTIQILDPDADGMAFVIQSVGPRALGQGGGGLGYAGIQKSLAFKLDLHSNYGEGSDSTGMYLNGAYPSTPSIDLGPARIDLHSGHIFAIHLAYANASTTAKITDTSTGVSTSGVFPGDIRQTVGDTAYIGFTAGTGNKTSAAKILTWSFSGGAGCAAR